MEGGFGLNSDDVGFDESGNRDFGQILTSPRASGDRDFLSPSTNSVEMLLSKPAMTSPWPKGN